MQAIGSSTRVCVCNFVLADLSNCVGIHGRDIIFITGSNTMYGGVYVHGI